MEEKDNRKKHLSVGCGKIHDKSTNDIRWTNIDMVAEVMPDVVCDMTKGLPFKDNEFDHVKAFACLGQIEKNSDFLFVMNELWRVLKSGGTIFIYLPHKDYQHCWLDPFNQRRTNEDHWNGFDENSRQYIDHNSYYGFKPWKDVNVSVANGFISIYMKASKV